MRTLTLRYIYIRCSLRIAAMLFAVATLFACQESLPQRCAREAKSYTAKNCPAKISDNITLDSLTFSENDSTIGYYYSVTGLIDSTELMAAHREEYYGVLKKDIRNATSLKSYKEAGFKFSYTYLSTKNKGKVLLSLKYKPEDYE